MVLAMEARGRSRRPDQLPPGRHGLTPEDVARSQRERLLQAVIDAVADKGYGEARVTDIIAGAGVSRKTFYEHFDEKEDCFLAAYDMQLTELTETTATAFAADQPRPWIDSIHAGARAFMQFLADRPNAARSCLIEIMAAGKTAAQRRDAALRNFTYFVDSGRGEAKADVPGFVALGVLGAVLEVIAAEINHGSPERLESLTGDVVYLIALPFLGPEVAAKERDRARAEGPSR